MHKRKNLFFKRRESKLRLISRRVSIVVRKKKRLRSFKPRRFDKGNFFLKKFFFKSLLKNRKFLKRLFNFNVKRRQLRITRRISLLSKNVNNNTANLFEYSLLNLVLRSGLIPFHKDVIKFIDLGLIYVNGFHISDRNIVLDYGDVIQLPVSIYMYKYIRFSRKILKKKVSFFKFTNWKFFKKRYLRRKQRLRPNKRKNPKYLYLLSYFKLNTPRFLEVDFLTLTAFIIKKQNTTIQPTYYITKLLSYKLFPLYNFKKIN